jgi:hypothetical protein
MTYPNTFGLPGTDRFNAWNGAGAALPPGPVDTYAPRPQLGPYSDQFLGGRLVHGPRPNTLLPIVGQPVGPSLLTRIAGLGSNGDEVSQLQQFLNGRLDPSPGLLDHGSFDEKTLEAVIAFQRSSGLKPDGKVDRKTWFKLLFGGKVAWPHKPQTGNTRAPTSSSIHPVAAWSVADKFDVVLTRTALQLPGDLRFTFQQVLDSGMRKTLSHILTTWAGALATNGSEAILFGLYSLRIGEVKLEAMDVIEDFNSCLTAASNASKQTHLDHAATYLARVITRLGVTLFLTVIHRIVTRHDAKRDEARPALAASKGPAGKPIDMRPSAPKPEAAPAGPKSVPKTAAPEKHTPPPDSPQVAAMKKAREDAAAFVEVCPLAQSCKSEAKPDPRTSEKEAARKKLDDLIKAQQAAEDNYWSDLAEGVWSGVKNDVNAIPGQLKDAALAGGKVIADTLGAAHDALTDPNNWTAAADALVQTGVDLVTSPIESAKKVGAFFGDVASTVGKVGVHIVTHPLDTLKAVAGVENWEKSMDPNVPVTERIGRVLVGIADAAMNVAGAGLVGKGAKVADAAIDAAKVADKVADVARGADAALDAAKVADKLADSAKAADAVADVAKTEKLADATQTADKLSDSAKAAKTADAVADGGRTFAYTADTSVDVAKHMTGMPDDAIKQAQRIADEYQAQILVRPTTPRAAELLESGEALPKICDVKNKTMNELDLLLKPGAKSDDLAKVGHFEPKLPQQGTMSNGEYAELKGRFNQRMDEFIKQEQVLAKNPNVVVKDGIVCDVKSGKPFTGDHDIFDIIGADGKPLPPDIKAQVLKELKQPPFSAQHPDQAAWDYSHLSREVPAGAPPGTISDYEQARRIDSKILESHQAGPKGKEPLIGFGPQRPPQATYLDGGG